MRTILITMMVGFLLLLGGSVVLSGCSGEKEVNPRLASFETDKMELWNRLGEHKETYLRKWERVFDSGTSIKPVDVIDAFNELAFQMTGPDGLWRNQVPILWLKCDENPEKPECMRLLNHNEQFKDWDVFQEKVSRLEPMRAGAFLLAHMDKMNGYLDVYILPTPDRKGMRVAPFYQKELTETVAEK